LNQRRLLNLAKIAITVGLLAYIFTKVDLAQVKAYLVAADYRLVALALAFYLLAIVVNGLKWQTLLRALQVRVPFSSMLQFMFVGFFFNNVLPANIGGDVMRGYGLARTTDRTAEAAVSVVVDRLVGLLAYMSTAVVTAIVVVRTMRHTELQWLFNVAVLAAVLIALALAVLFSRRLRLLVSKLFQRGPLQRLQPLYASISDALDAYRFHYRALLVAFLWGLVGLMAANIVNWLLFQAAGGGVPFVDVMLFNPLIALALLVPVSVGGHGVIQNVYPELYGLLGVPEAQATAVSVLMSLIIIVGSLPGGWLWLRGQRATANRKE